MEAIHDPLRLRPLPGGAASSLRSHPEASFREGQIFGAAEDQIRVPGSEFDLSQFEQSPLVILSENSDELLGSSEGLVQRIVIGRTESNRVHSSNYRTGVRTLPEFDVLSNAHLPPSHALAKPCLSSNSAADASHVRFRIQTYRRSV